MASFPGGVPLVFLLGGVRPLGAGDFLYIVVLCCIPLLVLEGVSRPSWWYLLGCVRSSLVASFLAGPGGVGVCSLGGWSSLVCVLGGVGGPPW